MFLLSDTNPTLYLQPYLALGSAILEANALHCNLGINDLNIVAGNRCDSFGPHVDCRLYQKKTSLKLSTKISSDDTETDVPSCFNLLRTKPL